MSTKGELKRFLKLNPGEPVIIAIDCIFHVGSSTVIASYSRERDARRALKGLGYTEEGYHWKPPVKRNIPSEWKAKEEA